MNVEQLFKKSAKLPASLLLQGEEAFFTRELKQAIERSGASLSEIDLKKKAPPQKLEEAAGGGSLFFSKSVLWISNPAPLSQWKAEHKAVWQELKRQADGEALCLFVQVPSDKRSKWDALGTEAIVKFELDPSRKNFWVSYMNESRDGFLSKEKIEFLASLEEDLLQLDNFVELWSLGGDFWAERSLGFQAGARLGPAKPANLAFAWVDAVITGDKKTSARYLRTLLIDESQEPLQLMGLLSKSVRILTAIEQSWDLSSQPPFLVDKLRRQKGRGTRLLDICKQIDVELKTSAIDKFAAMLRL